MPSDVCLLLEGTYPYVAGGVSTWVAQILDSMPHLRFSIVFIGASRRQNLAPKYAIPANVDEIRTLFVHDYPPHPGPGQAARSALAPADHEQISAFQRAVLREEPIDLAAVARAVARAPSDEALLDDLSRSRESWRSTLDLYEAFAPDRFPFLDFFWTCRFLHIPVLRLLRAPLPAARVYHAACTGYAGLLGARAAAASGHPFLLTEHGIYTRERRIEIFRADWIADRRIDPWLDMGRESGFTKQWWVRLFRAAGRAAYDAARRVTTLFQENARAQIRDGAAPERVSVIPNGIAPGKLAELPPPQRAPGEPLRIGFIGRIAAIKDVKTFLRALGILRARAVPFCAEVLGPLDEEEDYAAECQALAASLGLDEMVRFRGRVAVGEWLPRLDVSVLTSVSEGQPFVILEAGAAARPSVATDVGACREMLEGGVPADRALGPGGLLTPVASPERTAEALERLARDPGLVVRLGLAQRERVRRFYALRDVMRRYQDLYEQSLYELRSAAG